jgi:competence protein ComGC
MTMLFLVVELLGVLLLIYVLFRLAINSIPELNHWWESVTKKQNIKLARDKIETVEKTQEDLGDLEESIQKLPKTIVRKRRNKLLNNLPKE